jgi:hypothetical protein
VTIARSIPIFAAAALAAWAAGAGAAPGGGDECRAVTMPDGSSTRMCRDKAGRWVAEAEAVRNLPARAEALYQGTFSVLASRRTAAPRRLDLGRMLADAMQKQGDRFEGALTIKATFDGAAVNAHVSGTGGVDPGPLSGLVRNGHCRLVDPRNTIVYEGRCDAQGFAGTITSTSTSRMVYKGSFQTSLTQLTDVGRRDAEQAEANRIRDARRAELQRKCDAGSLTACVELDSNR